MSDWTYSRRIGGLMRCCLGSLDEQMVKRRDGGDGPPREGETLATSCCGATLLFRDEAWEWLPSLDQGRHSS